MCGRYIGYGIRIRFWLFIAPTPTAVRHSHWSIAAAAAPKTDESEKSFADARRRPCRPAPTVPPWPVPWLPMAMADLTGAVGIASRRARARASQQPSPAGDVGKRKQLRRLLSASPPAVGIAMQLPID